MHKVVIVDDDRIIRQGLSKLIPWEEHGLELVGVAADGEEGLQITKSESPHIVISDIRMPFMDGLEMARAINILNHKTKIILLTGYEDFKYAHEAIKLKAFDYLLKPVETSELIQKLQQASLEIKLESQKEQESQQYIQQKFLKRLCHKSFNSSEEVYKELKRIGITPTNSILAAFYIKIDQTDLVSPLSLEPTKEKMMGICKELLKQVGVEGYPINYESEHFAIILFGTDHQLEQFTFTTTSFPKQLLSEIINRLNITVTITSGRIYKDFLGLQVSFIEALKAMEFRHLLGTNSVYSINDVEVIDTNEGDVQPNFEEDLIRYISLGLPEKAKLHIEATKKELLNNKSVSLDQMRLLAIRGMNLIIHESTKVSNLWDSSKYRGLESKLMKMQTCEEIFSEIERVTVDIAGYINMVNESPKNSLVDKAIDFITEHYHVSNLTLQSVAEKVHVSAAYLSNLFKVEKGFNFGDFLLQTRMRKAMELLQMTDMKTYEIAEKVGYSNPQYFSSSFKKFSGYSPGEFKKLK